MSRTQPPLAIQSLTFGERLRATFRARFGLRFTVHDQRRSTQIFCAVAIIVFTAISVIVFRAVENKQGDGIATERAAASQQSGRITTGALTIDRFTATWSAQRAQAGNRATALTLSWRVRDLRDLRASLLALDATKLAVQRIDIARRDAHFAVVAEVAP